MAQVSHAYLSARPPSLLTSQLPYDDLLESPEGFAGRLYGCAFRSVEGGETPGSAILQRRVLVSMERLRRVILWSGSLFCHGHRTCNRVSPAHRGPRFRAAKRRRPCRVASR